MFPSFFGVEMIFFWYNFLIYVCVCLHVLVEVVVDNDFGGSGNRSTI